MIDMEPTDMSCIYSVLHFVVKLAKKHGIVPILTFDQPLCWQAIIITDAKPQDSNLHNLILIIGGLHTERSFLGSIGYLTIAPGLQQLLEVIYAPNAARCEHLNVDSALHTILASHVLGSPIPSQEVHHTIQLETTPRSPYHTVRNFGINGCN